MSETWNKENVSSIVRISVFEAFSNRSSVALWFSVLLGVRGRV